MKWRWQSCALACAALHTVAAGGAPAPGEGRGAASAEPDFTKAREFWAFQPVTLPQVPKVQSSPVLRSSTAEGGKFKVQNPVDSFIFARLQAKGLQPAPPASPAELIRRLCFDLTGLPPSPEEVKAFVGDTSPGAYERLVDRLLDSPHFGERSAQHWLDVVRYAESEGFEYDRHLPEAWRYRDYVIQSFQCDKPFDQFLTEQIAGDEFSSDDTTGPTAAIFHRLGPVRRNAGNPEIALSRNEVLTERTDVIGSAFLGLTVGCARCHNHKFDPISQKDYYRLEAYLAGTQDHDILLVPPEQKKEWEEKTKAFNAELRKLRKAADQAEGLERTKLNEQIEALEDKAPTSPPTIPSIRNDPAQRTEIHVLKRGDWEKKGETVAPRPLSVLVEDALPELPADLPNPRTQLARWLANPRHPLTARVVVNRLWQQHFGLGLVKTANDFGNHGDRPSHPELLDWLACELMAGGGSGVSDLGAGANSQTPDPRPQIPNPWSLKHIHRLIVTSSTYRQSSRSPSAAAAAKVDPENRLLWRFSQRRLSAEEIRDAMLAVSGALNPKMGGSSVMVPVDKELIQLLYKPAQWEVARDPSEYHRRSIYLIAKRNLRLPFLETFDQPASLSSCGRRESSTHAPQALEMLNGKLANELAAALAQRLENECGGEQGRMVDRAYSLAVGRPPTAKERALATAFLNEQSLKEFSLALFNLNAFLYVQ